MVQKLEAIRGGGGSIKVGTTGTIGALMSRELKSLESAPKTPPSPRGWRRTVAAKTSHWRKSLDEASSSKNFGIDRTYRVPILGSHNATLDGTPVMDKPERRGANIVEVVDIRCGNTDKAWTKSITKLKKLGFSKLSESII